MSGLFSRRAFAAAGAIAIAAGGLVASTVAPSNAAVAVSGVCKVQVLNGTGDVVGYLGALSEQTGIVLDTASNAALFDVSPGTRQELFNHATGDRIGLVEGASGNNLAAGSPAYTWLTRVSHTEPGAKPTYGSSANFDGNPVESSVWSLDADGALTPTWINSDGNPAPSTVFSGDYRDYYGEKYVGVIGDITRWQFSATLTAVTLKTSDCTPGKQDQSITFTSPAPEGALPKSSYTVSANGGDSGNAVIFSSTTPGTCRVKGNNVTFIKNGTCTVAANQAGNASYNAAPQVTQNITVGRIAQTIEFTSTPPAPANPAGTYDVTASGGASGNPVTFSTNTNICTVSGGTVTFVRTGKCVITAKQAGNSRYAPAANVKQTVNVVKAPK